MMRWVFTGCDREATYVVLGGFTEGVGGYSGYGLTRPYKTHSFYLVY